MNTEEVGKQKYLTYVQKRRDSSYSRKMILSGRFVEEYTYENRIYCDQEKHRKRRKKTNKEQTEMRSGALRRARMNIMRLVNSNLDFITFITLTFDENKFENKKDITEFEKCNYLFMKFIQRLKYNFAGIKYLVVPEFQGDYYYQTDIKKEFGGAIHYHLLSNKEINAEKLSNIWGHGFVKINKIESIDNIGLYISKYLSKESFNKKYFGKKKLFYSKNLDRPQEFKGDSCKAIASTYLPMLDKVYETEFYNEYRGNVKVTIYKLQALPTDINNF